VDIACHFLSYSAYHIIFGYAQKIELSYKSFSNFTGRYIISIDVNAKNLQIFETEFIFPVDFFYNLIYFWFSKKVN